MLLVGRRTGRPPGASSGGVTSDSTVLPNPSWLYDRFRTAVDDELRRWVALEQPTWPSSGSRSRR